mmetsp:Transcript_25652/g.53544  ORF Transcript_25652/g.53544 Transcript_25652/m.53544 type:complete len:228 (+) Transcript_25652:501-1184(+)
MLLIGSVSPRNIKFSKTFVTLDDLPVVGNIHAYADDPIEEVRLVLGINPLWSLKFHCINNGRQCNRGGSHRHEPIIPNAQLRQELRELAHVVPNRGRNFPGDEMQEIPAKCSGRWGMDVPLERFEHRLFHRDNMLGREEPAAEFNETGYVQLRGLGHLDGEVERGHGRELEDAAIGDCACGREVAIEVRHGYGYDFAVEIIMIYNIIAPLANLISPKLIDRGGRRWR